MLLLSSKNEKRQKIAREKRRENCRQFEYAYTQINNNAHIRTHSNYTQSVKSKSASMFSSDQFCFPHWAIITIQKHTRMNVLETICVATQCWCVCVCVDSLQTGLSYQSLEVWMWSLLMMLHSRSSISITLIDYHF